MICNSGNVVLAVVILSRRLICRDRLAHTKKKKKLSRSDLSTIFSLAV